MINIKTMNKHNSEEELIKRVLINRGYDIEIIDALLNVGSDSRSNARRRQRRIKDRRRTDNFRDRASRRRRKAPKVPSRRYAADEWSRCPF